jgi:hypothetical protein
MFLIAAAESLTGQHCSIYFNGGRTLFSILALILAFYVGIENSADKFYNS